MNDASNAPVDPLAALKAELAAIEAARDAKRKPSPEQQKAALEQKIADMKALASAEDAHGANGVGIAVYDTGEGLVIVRRADPIRYRRYLAVQTKLLGKDTEAGNAQLIEEAHKLVHQCLVHPSTAAFDTLADKFPNVPNLVAGLIDVLASGRAREASEKL